MALILRQTYAVDIWNLLTTDQTEGTAHAKKAWLDTD